jgi:hypothetical protein
MKRSDSPEAVRERLARRRGRLGFSHSKDWNRENPEKRRAQKMVENHLKSGKLVREPCERCGCTVRIQAHHEDYAKPLDVMWLCPLHHRERHKELKFFFAQMMEITNALCP